VTLIGYTMICELAGPKQLVRDLALAEQAGFDFAYGEWPCESSQGDSEMNGDTSPSTRPSRGGTGGRAR